TGPGTRWDRYAALVGRRAPWVGLAGLLVLGLLAVPAASMRLAHVDAGSDPVGSSARTAYDRISAGFGEGANGPLTVVVDLTADPGTPPAEALAADLAADLATALAADPGVAAASPALVVPQTDLLVVQVVPTTGPSESTTADTRDRLADEVLPAVLAQSASTAGTGAGGATGTGFVTGVTASQLEFRDTLAERLPVVMAVVASLAFLILL
nr:MMPL family transporter [Micromonospora sp. DSM 115978]